MLPLGWMLLKIHNMDRFSSSNTKTWNKFEKRRENEEKRHLSKTLNIWSRRAKRENGCWSSMNKHPEG